MIFDFLWTDKCFLTVLTLATIATLFSLRKPPIRASIAYIFSRPLAISASMVLLVFLIIGVLDSIHFKSDMDGAVNATSLLDKILAPVGMSYEKSYSSPMSLNAFTTETTIKHGVAQQTYPKLQYPAPYFKNKSERSEFIRHVLLTSCILSLGVTVVFWLCIIGLKWVFTYPSSFSLSPSNISVLFTLFVLSFLVLSGYNLSRCLHVLGTGQIGEDIFYYTIKSIRTGLIIGLLTTLFMFPLALFLGISAGYFGGIVDDVIQYVYTTLSSIPGVLLITAAVLSLQIYIANHPEQFATLAQSADARLLALCIILGVTSWTSLCRLLRAETLKLREVDYVMAARALGSSWFTIIRKHLLPNVMHIVIITLVLDFSFLIMAEAVLSYVGVGVSPMTISWGNMINGARLELAREPIVWWPIFAAFLFMFVLVLALNLFADAVRDAFDPRHKM